MTRARWRDQVIVAVVAFITAVYGVVLVQSAQLAADLTFGVGPAAAVVFITAIVFIALGAYSAAVVTANAFATIVAGRIREIAQYRLLGASATRLRAALTGEGIGGAVAGTVSGIGAGVGAYALVLRLAVDSGNLPDLAYTLVSWRTLVPAVIVIATVAIAAWVGTRPITQVSPMQALGQSVEDPLDLRRTPVSQRVFAVAGLVVGGLLLIGGVVLGARSPLGLPVAFAGGVASFSGFVIGARMLVPALLRIVGRAFGRGAPARLAQSNAIRSPQGATRGAIGMIVGVTLIVMFVVAVSCLRVVLADLSAGLEAISLAAAALIDLLLDVIMWIAVALVGVSAVIGAAGIVANLSLAVLQRQRELGLLRAIGATAGQVRASIGIEAMLMSIVAIGTGFVLGVIYGWIGAQAAIGSFAGGIAPLVVPWWLFVGVSIVTIVLAALATIAPALRSTRVTPVDALAADASRA